mmetsp:Transcript_11330/g.28602  ORF Transcript_11330/g.28602 Transcript_11330/m.28602 type:complete len:451 (+) Transcript_11330:222-1574(+)
MAARARLVLVVLAAAAAACAALARATAGPRGQLLRVDLGSCNNQNLTQLLWGHVAARQPDAWLWGGDNIYADARPRSAADWYRLITEEPKRLARGPRGFFYPTYLEKLELLYKIQKQEPGYAAVRKLVGKENILAIWDDHDYGLNDAGKEVWSMDFQNAFLDFVDAPADDVRRERRGIYEVRDLADGAIRFILLDNRSFRDSYDNTQGDMLGEAQWAFLEEALATSKARFNVIVSGVQVFPEQRLRRAAENWMRFPAARERLLRMLSQSTAQGVFFVSGDVHFSELLAAKCSCSNGVHFSVGEFTSSGMTHSWKTYPALMRWAMYAAHRMLPFQYSLDKVYLGRSFGEFDFDEASMTTRAFDIHGDVVFEHVWRLDELKPAKAGKDCQCLPVRGPHPAPAVENLMIAAWVIATLLPLVALVYLVYVLTCFACRGRSHPVGAHKVDTKKDC